MTVIEAVKQRGSGELTLVPTLRYTRGLPPAAPRLSFLVSRLDLALLPRGTGSRRALAGVTHRAGSSIAVRIAVREAESQVAHAALQ